MPPVLRSVSRRRFVPCAERASGSRDPAGKCVVRVQQASIANERLPRYGHELRRGTAKREYSRRDRITDRKRGWPHSEDREIGFLPRLERTDPAVETECPRATQGRELQRLRGGQRGVRPQSRALLQHGGARFLQNV